MPERVIHADGVELATEAFGDAADEPVLLIMGMMSSMLWWPDEFCKRLAQRGRFVIRFDHRDTGLSTTWPVGSPGYTGEEMADDAIRVLDGFHLPSAHLVGISMGGALAQLATLRHPDRVATLTTISTSPLGEDTSTLPGSKPDYLERSERLGEPDWYDRVLAIDHLVEDSRLTAGSAHPFDEPRLRRLIEQDYDRANSFPSVTNHTRLSGGEVASGSLRTVSVPVLVIHGTEDPLFPIEHGIALSQAVRVSTLVRLEGSGHELAEGDWDQIVTAIIAHTGNRGRKPESS